MNVSDTKKLEVILSLCALNDFISCCSKQFQEKQAAEAKDGAEEQKTSKG
ncbi:hypothetical protein [Limisalsivibrio acetivorans]|nr:hypothetical protein [Limisalsivibrio acetivorans]